MFDKDGSKTLDREELRAILSRPVAGQKEMSEDDIDEILNKFDTNNDGVIDLSEFIEMMSDGDIFEVS